MHSSVDFASHVRSVLLLCQGIVHLTLARVAGQERIVTIVKEAGRLKVGAICCDAPCKDWIWTNSPLLSTIKQVLPFPMDVKAP